jgi:hypothetical protein
MRTWNRVDVRKAVEALLDGFAEEFFEKAQFRNLPAAERLKLIRVFKTEISDKAAYEWLMRGIERA